MSRLPTAARRARQLWPVALALYRRWDRLPDDEKERYIRHAREQGLRTREAAKRSGDAVSAAWRRRRGGR